MRTREQTKYAYNGISPAEFGERTGQSRRQGMRPPNPGSDEAQALGCCCAVLDNARGKGRFGDGEKYGWWYSGGCPVHFPIPSPTEQP